MNNSYSLYSSGKLDYGVVISHVSTLPSVGVSDNDRYWYIPDNCIHIYNSSTSSWSIKYPVDGSHFFLKTDGKTYVCHNGLFKPNSYDDTVIKQDITNLQTDSHTHLHKAVLDKFDEDVTGNPTYDGNPIKTTLPIATTTVLGGVKPDGTTITVLADGTISSTAISGTTDYTVLTNKPHINNVELSGNKTLIDLGIQPSGSYLVASDIANKLEVTNIKAGSNVTLNKVGNDITINSTATSGSNVADSTINGNILIDNVETNVYTLPNNIATLSDIPSITNKLESTNIKAGTDISVSVIGNDVTINSTAINGGSTVTDSTINGNIIIDSVETTVYTLPSDVAKMSDIPDVSAKLEAVNIISGSNITTSVNGNNVTINANASAVDSVARQDIADLTITVNGKAPTVHTHAISDVTNLQTSLNNKIETSVIGAVSGVASLGTDGKVPSAQLPTSYQLTLGTSSTDAYYGDKGKIAYDHSLLTSGNPHNVTKTNIGLGNVINTDTTTTANIADSLNKRFVTDAQKTILSNTSGTNSGDESATTIKTKLGSSSSTVDGYLTSSDWNTFNNKVNFVAGKDLVSTTEIAKIHNSSLLGTKTLDETNVADKKVIMYDSTTETLIYDDVAIPTATDMTTTEVNTVVTDIQQSTNSTPENTVGTLRDLRNVIKENNTYLDSHFATDMTSTEIINVVDDVENSTNTTAVNTTITRVDVRDIVKGNNVKLISKIDTVTETKVNEKLLTTDISQGNPIGAVILYGGTTAPIHYLKMDGTIYNIATYQELADFYKTNFGSYNYFGGDGITTFAVQTQTSGIANTMYCVKYESTFYAVNQYAGFNQTTLFTGTANTVNVAYSLSDTIDNYDQIGILTSCSGSTLNIHMNYYPLSVIVKNLVNNLQITEYSTRHLMLHFNSASNSFTVDGRAGDIIPSIYKIIGIKSN